MDLYAENILDHYRHPHHKQTLTAPDASYKEVNASCGDFVEVQLVIRDGVIAEIGWDGHGCAISQAAMSLLADELPGKPVDQALRLGTADVKLLLGVPIGLRRWKCAFLCLQAVRNALRVWKGEKPAGWERPDEEVV